MGIRPLYSVIFPVCTEFYLPDFQLALLVQALFAVLLVLSALISFAGFQYGVIVDQDMLVNVLETDRGEAGSYLTIYSVLWLLGFGLVPALALLFTPIRPEKSALRFLMKKGLSMLVSVVVIGVIAGLYYQNYSSVGRNNSSLKKMIIPTHFLYSSFGLVKQRYFTEPMVYQEIGQDAQQKPSAVRQATQKPTLVFFVLGETARVQNYQYLGYPRDTNAYTALSSRSFLKMWRVAVQQPPFQCLVCSPT